MHGRSQRILFQELELRRLRGGRRLRRGPVDSRRFLRLQPLVLLVETAVKQFGLEVAGGPPFSAAATCALLLSSSTAAASATSASTAGVVLDGWECGGSAEGLEVYMDNRVRN